MSTILVVDDSPDMAALMAFAVEKQGHRALVAGDGRAGLQLARDARPDVILLDVMMPVMTGLEVLERLKAEPPLCDIPVILVTALGEDRDVIAGLDAGAHDYMTKPFRREMLAARMRAALRAKESCDRLKSVAAQLRAEIADRQRVERELAQAQKLESIGRLAAGIAHEINTPAQFVGDNVRFLSDTFAALERLLAGFPCLLEAARHGGAGDLVAGVEAAWRAADVDYLREETPKALRQAQRGIERVTQIVRAMSDFAQSAAHREPVDLNRAVESILTISRNQWKDVAEVETHLDPALPLVPCLPGEVKQALLHLVVNAAEAVRAAAGRSGTLGKITVRTRLETPWAVVRIEDTGTGIPEEIQPRIFEPFFTTKEEGGGSGQGLSIARSVVAQQHGGRIAFESAVGRGTTFIVQLPLDASSRMSEAGDGSANAAAESQSLTPH